MQAEHELWRSLGERLLIVASALTAAGIPHAFGGAVAYNYVGEPRGTRDIDVNIFLPPTESETTLRALERAGVPVELERSKLTIARTGQDRIRWEQIPIDLFFSTVPFHESSQQRVRLVPFRGLTIPVLAAEDIALCKIEPIALAIGSISATSWRFSGTGSTSSTRAPGSLTCSRTTTSAFSGLSGWSVS